MTHLDQMITDALAQSPDTVVHQLASEVVRLRGELEAARAEIADLKRGGVVSARDLDGLWQIVEREREWRLQDLECKKDEIRESVGRLRREWDEATSSLRTIPADRVLREGEARIGMNELQMLRCFAGRRMSEREYDRLEAVRDAHEEALRAYPTQEPTT